jgi:hypothetical protein
MDFEETKYTMGEEEIDEEKEDTEVNELGNEEELTNEMLKFVDTKNIAKYYNNVHDTNIDFLKIGMTYMQVQMDDMEKSIITLMKVTNGLM